MKGPRRVHARAIATTLGLVLVFLMIGPTPAGAARLSRLYDFVKVKTSRVMTREALRARLEIDTDMDVLLTPEVHVAFATVEGFESLDLEKGAREGVEVGFLFLSGHHVVPAGFYVMEFVIDPDSTPGGQEDDHARLIATRGGEEFRFPLTIAPDAQPGLDPRKSLSVVAGRNFEVSVHQELRTYSMPITAELDIRPLHLPLAQIGENFAATFMTSNGLPPDSFTSSDPLPPGLALSGSSLTGAPTDVGDFSFTIHASDSAGNQGMRNYTLTVLPAGLLILTNALPDGVVNASYGAQVLALGGVEPYRWRVDGGVPAGLTFSDTGFFNGRPTVAGTSVVTVTVHDQAGAEATADLSLTVLPTGLITLTPDSLPNGFLGAAYNLPVLPSGGTPPYHCELVEGALPPGLGFSDCASTVSGIPRLAGIFGFTLRIRDSDPKLPRTLLLSRHIRVVEAP